MCKHQLVGEKNLSCLCKLRHCPKDKWNRNVIHHKDQQGVPPKDPLRCSVVKEQCPSIMDSTSSVLKTSSPSGILHCSEVLLNYISHRICEQQYHPGSGAWKKVSCKNPISRGLLLFYDCLLCRTHTSLCEIAFCCTVIVLSRCLSHIGIYKVSYVLSAQSRICFISFLCDWGDGVFSCFLPQRAWDIKIKNDKTSVRCSESNIKTYHLGITHVLLC